MASRLELQAKLEELLGTRNVYYNPPNSVQMKYDAIRYSLADIKNTYAGDSVYYQVKPYKVTVICTELDPEIVTKLSKMPKCRFDRYYASDGLHHYTFILYY